MLDPIHLKDMFSKTQLIEELHQTQKQSPEADHRQFAAQMQHQIQEEHLQAHQSESKEDALIRQEDRNQGQKQEKKEKEETSDDSSNQKEPRKRKNIISAGKLDVTV